MKTAHRKSLAQLGDYAAGELTPVEHQEITAHLLVCAICRRELAEIEQIRARLRSFALPVAPVEQEGAVFSSFLDSQEERVTIPGQEVGMEHRQSPRRPTLFLAAAFVAFTLLLSVMMVFAITAFQNYGAARPHLTPTSHPQQPCSPLPFPQGETCMAPTPIPTPTPTPTPISTPTPTPTSPITIPTPTPTPTPTSPITIPTPTPTPASPITIPTPTPTP